MSNVMATVRVPYYTYGPPPDDDHDWEWHDPVPWVDEFGFEHPGFGYWERPTTHEERVGKDRTETR